MLNNDFARLLLSSIPENELDARLRSLGIEDKNIIKIKESIGFKGTKDKEEKE